MFIEHLLCAKYYSRDSEQTKSIPSWSLSSVEEDINKQMNV